MDEMAEDNLDIATGTRPFDKTEEIRLRTYPKRDVPFVPRGSRGLASTELL
jgi:hypothetical protein